MTTDTATAVVSSSIFLGRDRGFTPHQTPPPHGDLAPLTLLDILPDRNPTATEHRDSWRSFGEIADGIVQDLALRRLRDE